MPTYGNRQLIYFDAAIYEADVYLNVKKLGKHIGGFTPFNFEITGKLKSKGNFVIVKVDNTADWKKYQPSIPIGGIMVHSPVM